MKKILGLFLFFGFSLYSYGQTLSDSTKFYLNIENEDISEAIHFCISKINTWNDDNQREKGLINIQTSNSDVFELEVSHFYPLDSSVIIMPDYYSYINNNMVLWYMGLSNLINPSREFKEFVIKCHARLCISKEEISEESFNKAPSKISFEVMSKLDPVPMLNFAKGMQIPQPPIYKIKVNGGKITVTEVKKIIR